MKIYFALLKKIHCMKFYAKHTILNTFPRNSLATVAVTGGPFWPVTVQICTKKLLRNFDNCNEIKWEPIVDTKALQGSSK